MHTRFFLNGTTAEVGLVTHGLACLRGLHTPVHETARGQARRVMRMVTEEVDEDSLEMFLEFSPSHRTDPRRLESLYREFEFVRATELSAYEWRKLRGTIGPCYRDVIMFRPRWDVRSGARTGPRVRLDGRAAAWA